MKREANYHEVIYHINGYNKFGGFVSESFEKLNDAFAYWGNDNEWLNAALDAEHFYADHREQENIKDIEVVPIHKLFRH